MFTFMNYRQCATSVTRGPTTRGPTIAPMSAPDIPDTTTDYYGNMDCRVFKGEIQN